ncbi:hypothetical protein LCE32_20345, partial [Streptomyces sp. 7G]|uniref:hypothetical protein n=1 Tax=Streptomyces sp. 7G TaxID=2877241 RepID=UPI001CD199B0
MAGKAGGGRPWGPIRAENQHARKLAETFRGHVDACGKTLADLAVEISMSKAQTGVYLAGKVPTEKFVVALIRATVRPELRERRQEEALELRQRALFPATRPASETTPREPSYAVELAAAQTRQLETYDRLTRSLEQQAAVERARINSDKLVMVLLHMIHQLDRRVAALARQRDALLSQPQIEALGDTERKLARAEAQAERAQLELRRAEDKQRKAEELSARVQEQLLRLTDELDRLRTGDASPLDRLPAVIAEPDPTQQSGPMDPVGDDIDHLLVRAGTVNDEDDDTLSRVASELDEAGTWVVRDNRVDNSSAAKERMVTGPPAPGDGRAVHDLLARVAQAGDKGAG